MSRYALLTVLLFLCGCAANSSDDEVARRTWLEIGGPAGVRVEYRRVPFLPFAYGNEKALTFCGPPGVPIEAVVRYEGVKVLQQLRAARLPWPISWLVWIEALLHGPVSEYLSWREVFFPKTEPRR